MHVYTTVHICVHVYICVCVCACHSVYVEVRTTSGVSSCHLSCLRQGLVFFTIAYAGFPGFLLSLSPTSSWLALQMCATVDSYGCCILRSSPSRWDNSPALCSVFITRILHLCLVDTGLTPGLNYISEKKWCMVLLGRTLVKSLISVLLLLDSSRQLLPRIHVEYEKFSILVEGQGLVWDQPQQVSSLSVYLCHTSWALRLG